MNFDHIERIIPLAQEKIFTFDIVEPHAIDVEFITVQGFFSFSLGFVKRS